MAGVLSVWFFRRCLNPRIVCISNTRVELLLSLILPSCLTFKYKKLYVKCGNILNKSRTYANIESQVNAAESIILIDFSWFCGFGMSLITI